MEKEKKINPFQNFAERLFSPIGGTVRGALRGLAPGMAEQHDLQKKLLANQALLKKMQRVALEQGRDPYERAGKLALAHTRLTDAGAEEAAGAVLGKINELTGTQAGIDKEQKTTANETALAEYFQSGLEELEDKEVGRASREAVGKFEEGFAREAKKQGVSARNAELLFGKLYSEERGKAGILRDDVLPRRDVIDNRGYFSYDQGETKSTTTPKVRAETPAMAFEDLTQASTPDFPEENVPKTFEQLGITDVSEQAILQEMQKALPEKDMRQEYEDDPEGMQRLMKLWREGKLTRKNLHKAFATIQDRAREALGIA